MFVTPVGYNVPVEYNEGLSGFKIGKFFKKIGISFGRIASAGLWDPAKNRFFVPFSSGHIRTLGKGWTTALTGGLVNADKFFDTRTMRTIGTVTGAVAGAVTGAVAAPALIGAASSAAGSIGGVVSSGFGALKTLGTGLQLFQTGSQLLGGGLFGGGKPSVEGGQVQEVPQTGYPTLVNPVSVYPYGFSGVPYQYNPYVPMGAYQYSDGNVQKTQDVYAPPTVQAPTIKRETLPGGVDIVTLSGSDDMVNSFGVRVSYRQ